MKPERGSGARVVARKLALQALYRWQLNVCPWQDLQQEFAGDPDMARADGEYFQILIRGVCEQRDALDAALAPLLDRKPLELDPIEHALLLIGSYELLAPPRRAVSRRHQRGGRVWRGASVPPTDTNSSTACSTAPRACGVRRNTESSAARR